MKKFYTTTKMSLPGINNGWRHIRNVIQTVLILLICTFSLEAQFLIMGTVTDESGEPLIGTHISIKGSNTGTCTNLEGEYAIEVFKGDTLEFSYTGFERKLIEAKGHIMDAVLIEGITLTEVMILGLGPNFKRVCGCCPISVLNCFTKGVKYQEFQAYNTTKKMKSQNSDVFPNPFTSYTTVRIPDVIDGEFRVQVYSMDGKRLHQFAKTKTHDKQTVRIELASMPAGTYLLNVISSGGVVFSELVVKVRG